MSEDYTKKDVKDTEDIREAMRGDDVDKITHLDLMKNDAYAHMRREGEEAYTYDDSEAADEHREITGRFDGANDLDNGRYHSKDVSDVQPTEDEGDEDNLGDEDDETYREEGETDEVILPEMNDLIDDSDIDDSSFDCD